MEYRIVKDVGRKLSNCASVHDRGHLLEESEENHNKLEGYSIFVSRFERGTFQDIHQECWPGHTALSFKLVWCSVFICVSLAQRM
jgi:hypothetical protein